MKKFKKIMAVLVAAIMVVAMTVPAMVFADDGMVITIKSRADAEGTNSTVYNLYKVFSAEYDVTLAPVTDTANNLNTTNGTISGTLATPVAYYVTDSTLAGYIGLVKASDGTTPLFKVDGPSSNGRYYVSLAKADATPLEIANGLNDSTLLGAIAAADKDSKTAQGNDDVVFDHLDKGYYLITADNGINLIAQTLGNVTIHEKNDYPTIDKNITAVNGTALSSATKTNDVNIGDKLKFEVFITIPSSIGNTTGGTVKEVLQPGLTLSTAEGDTVVTYGAEGTGTTITGVGFVADGATAGHYKMDFTGAQLFAAAGKKIKIVYYATLNADATIDGAGNKNTVSFDYSHYSTPQVETVTKTHKFEIDKRKYVTEGTAPRLAGAKFTLTRDNGGTTEYYTTKNGTDSIWSTTYAEYTSTDSANIIFDGLDSGSYVLTEVEAPSGYIMLSSPVNVSIAEDGAVTYTCTDTSVSGNTASSATATNGVITLSNKAGTQLPSTGGMGTTVLYIVGGMLVILAGAYLFFSRKRTA